MGTLEARACVVVGLKRLVATVAVVVELDMADGAGMSSVGDSLLLIPLPIA